MLDHYDKIFLTQISFSAVTVGFCITMIAINPTPTTTSVFLPILTSVIGVWLPSPSSSKPTENKNVFITET
jgi:hypothetical protein